MRPSSLILTLILAATAYAADVKYGEREVSELVEIAVAEKEPEARRARAIRELEKTELRTFLGKLRRLMREERSLDIRLSAAVTLSALGDREAPRDLLLVSAYDRSRTPNCTRSDVVLALARIGEPAAEMHLEQALRDPAPDDEPFFHADVCRALRILGTPGARRILLGALRQGPPAVRLASVSPLSALTADRKWKDRPEAIAEIIRAARAGGDEKGDEKVADHAASALLWSGVDGPAFFRLLEKDPDPIVRARAARVMDRHYLSPARISRLRTALANEKDPAVRTAMETTLRGQSRR